ncbi:MAG: hypothetical protein L3J03_04735 [Desulfobacterales bacterium]|nr:hypothetical protein [Desulfobacterales bacterium]
MRGRKGAGVPLLVAVALVFALIYIGRARPGAAERPRLELADCIKCHQKESATIAGNESRHKTAVTCLDCHREHGPWGRDIIPPCTRCHQGRSHFKLANCLNCHSDPHNPLELVLADVITAPCLTCHQEQGKEFEEFPSRHSQQACTFCHEKHGQIPQCLQCHEPHTYGQTMADCLGCHPAHRPLRIFYKMSTPRRFCVACHPEPGKMLRKTKIKHRKFTCAYCHRGGHPSRPGCWVCHGKPHAPKMHRDFPLCLDCHMDNHNVVK